MKIIITEAQYEKLTEETLKTFLFSFWDNQKKNGEEPFLDDVIYHVTDIKKNSKDDYETIRPIWYEYNGGFNKIIQEMKDLIEHDEFQIKGDANLDMVIFVDEVYPYGLKEHGGVVDIICKVLGGTVDGYIYNEDTGDFDIKPNMDIFDQHGLLDYDTSDFEQFLTDETYAFFSKLLKNRIVPIYIDLIIK
jgi:hypothetical protein